MEFIDVVGPMEGFVFANISLQREGLTTEPRYRIEVLGKDGKAVTRLSDPQIVPTNGYGNDLDCSNTLHLKNEKN